MIAKLKCQVIQVLNIIVNNIQSHIKPVNNLYKASLEDIIVSNIENFVTKIVHIKLKQ